MKKLMSILLAMVLLLSSVGVLAESSAVGTWVFSQASHEGVKYPASDFPELAMVLVIGEDNAFTLTTQDGSASGTCTITGNMVHLGGGIWFSFSGDTMYTQQDGVVLYLSRIGKPSTDEKPEEPETPQDPETPEDKPEEEKPSAPAVQAEKVVKTGNSGGLALRTEARKGNNILRFYPNGTKVSVYSVDENGWAKVLVDGQNGYMMDKFLAKAETEQPEEKPEDKPEEALPVIAETIVKTGNSGGLALREAAGKSGRLIAYYPNGTKVFIHEVKDGWVKATVNGKTGYMMMKYLAAFKVEDAEQPEDPETPADPEKPEEEKPSTPAVLKEMVIKTGNSGGLALRRQAVKANNIIAFYPNGTKVLVHALEDGWAKVTVEGKAGYMMVKFLADMKAEEEKPADPENPADPEQPEETLPVIAETIVKTGNSGGLALRAKAEKGNNIYAYYKNGTKVAIHGVEGEWAHVTVNDRTGYMMVKYLASFNVEKPEEEKPETPETPADPEQPEEKPEDKPEEKPAAPAVIGQKVVKTGNSGGLALRSAAERKSDNILAFYDNGTVVNLHGVKNGWAHVTVNGVTGYMMDKYLATVEPETPAEPETPEQPQQPETPAEPETPEEPQQPETPADPETPEEPQQPETPADPETPEEPQQPETPAEPETPEQPQQPENTDTAA